MPKCESCCYKSVCDSVDNAFEGCEVVGDASYTKYSSVETETDWQSDC